MYRGNLDLHVSGTYVSNDDVTNVVLMPQFCILVLWVYTGLNKFGKHTRAGEQPIFLQNIPQTSNWV